MRKISICLCSVILCIFAVVLVFFLSTTSVQGTVVQVGATEIIIKQEDGVNLSLSTNGTRDFRVGDRVTARVGGALLEIYPYRYTHTYFVRAIT